MKDSPVPGQRRAPARGQHKMRPYKSPGPRVPLHYDREAATLRAHELRMTGLSLREVGLQLRKERLTPLRGGIWHPAYMHALLASDEESADRGG